MKRIIAAFLFSVFAGIGSASAQATNQDAQSDEQEVFDFSDRITPTCELQGLRTSPPPQWINVPIETGESELAGCQMMYILNRQLIGLLRVWSFDWSTAPTDLDPWPQQIMTLESVWIEEMGYTMVEPIWRRAEVPISGPGFGNGQAMGFSVKVEGNNVPQESHMLVFDRGNFKYLINLITPAKSVDDGRHYSANTDAMASVMQSFKLVSP